MRLLWYSRRYPLTFRNQNYVNYLHVVMTFIWKPNISFKKNTWKHNSYLWREARATNDGVTITDAYCLSTCAGMPLPEPVTTQRGTMECKIMVWYLSQPTTGILKASGGSGHALLTMVEEPRRRDACCVPVVVAGLQSPHEWRCRGRPLLIARRPVYCAGISVDHSHRTNHGRATRRERAF